MRRGYYDLVKYAAPQPAHLGTHVDRGVEGLSCQLFYRPFYWEKRCTGSTSP